MIRQALILVLLTGLACQPLPDVAYEGAHIRVAPGPGLELCAGSLAHMDDFIARLAAELDVPPPIGDDRILYYWLSRDDFDRLSPCPRDSLGCALGAGGDIFSTEAPLNHELVHHFAYDRSSFFGEGLAVAYEGLGSMDGSRNTEVWQRDLWRSLDASIYYKIDYDDAGAFVAYLIDSYGLAAYLEAMADLPALSTRPAIDRVFRDVFGVTLAASVAEFAAERQTCPHDSYDRKLSECSAPKIGWDGQRYAEYRRLAADEPDAIGPFDGDRLLVLRTLDIPLAGEYELELVVDPLASADPSARPAVSLTACGGCDTEPMFSTNTRARATLGAGSHSLRLHGSASADTRIGFSLTRVADPTPE